MAHEPRFRRVKEFVNPVQEMINSLIDEVFSFEIKNLYETLHKLVTENQALGGTMNVFLHEGGLYSPLPLHLIKGVKNIKPLHPSLHAPMSFYLKRQTMYLRDKRRITHSLSVVALKCKTLQDVRDVFPDPLINRVAQFSAMPRLRDEGWILKDNPTLFKQFQESVNILLDYQANRLVY